MRRSVEVGCLLVAAIACTTAAMLVVASCLEWAWTRLSVDTTGAEAQLQFAVTRAQVLLVIAALALTLGGLVRAIRHLDAEADAKPHRSDMGSDTGSGSA